MSGVPTHPAEHLCREMTGIIMMGILPTLEARDLSQDDSGHQQGSRSSCTFSFELALVLSLTQKSQSPAPSGWSPLCPPPPEAHLWLPEFARFTSRACLAPP